MSLGSKDWTVLSLPYVKISTSVLLSGPDSVGHFLHFVSLTLHNVHVVRFAAFAGNNEEEELVPTQRVSNHVL